MFRKIGFPFSIFLLIGLWGFALVIFFQAPAEIPIHFNFKGEIDRMGKKEIIFLLPLIATIISLFFNYLIKNPSTINNTSIENVPHEKRTLVQQLATDTLSFTLIILLLAFYFIEYVTYRYAKGQTSQIPFWFSLVITLLLLLPSLWLVVRIYRFKKN